MKYFYSLIVLLTSMHLSFSQAWMTDLEIAQKLALTQNKMVLMVWEETTKYEYPVLVNDENDNIVFIRNLFEDEEISPLIWKHFVPVIVSEYKYAELFAKIKDKRSQSYIDKFNDDSIKIMDVNGNILNHSIYTENNQNITELILKYALSTEFLATELKGYRHHKDFYSAYYLASKYIDFAMYMNQNIRSEIIDLANIYLDEASDFIASHPKADQKKLTERVGLLKTQQFLITKQPKKVLRLLKRMKTESYDSGNQSFVAFLYYTSHLILNNENELELWKSKISSVDLRKAQQLYNLNRVR